MDDDSHCPDKRNDFGIQQGLHAQVAAWECLVLFFIWNTRLRLLRRMNR